VRWRQARALGSERLGSNPGPVAPGQVTLDKSPSFLQSPYPHLKSKGLRFRFVHVDFVLSGGRRGSLSLRTAKGPKARILESAGSGFEAGCMHLGFSFLSCKMDRVTVPVSCSYFEGWLHKRMVKGSELVREYSKGQELKEHSIFWRNSKQGCSEWGQIAESWEAGVHRDWNQTCVPILGTPLMVV
jgi:hypothetical protein